MGLSEGQRQRWQFRVMWLRSYGGEDESLADTTLAVAAHLEEMEAEVERLTRELAETQEALHEAQAELGRRADRLAELEGDNGA